MSLSPALSVGSYTHQYHSQGYLVYQHQGQAAKVCADSLNTSLSQDQAQTFVRSLANTTCSHLQYDKMSWAAITRDAEEAEVQYVGVSARLRLATGNSSLSFSPFRSQHWSQATVSPPCRVPASWC